MQAISIAMAGIQLQLEHISSLSPTSENSDYGVTQMKRIRDVLDSLLQDFPASRLTEELHSMRSRVIHMLDQ